MCKVQDEGTSAVEVSVEAALYAESWLKTPLDSLQRCLSASMAQELRKDLQRGTLHLGQSAPFSRCCCYPFWDCKENIQEKAPLVGGTVYFETHPKLSS